MEAPDRSMRDMFRAFSRAELGTDDVMLALMAYDGFLVPQHLLPPDQVQTRGLMLTSQQPDPRGPELLLFTDLEAAQRAANQIPALGTYVAGQDAMTWVGALRRHRWPKGIQVNPGPKDERWVMGPDAYGLVEAWGYGVALERAAAAGAANVSELLQGHPALLVPHLRGVALTRPVGGGNALVVCATISAYREVVRQVGQPLEQRAVQAAAIASYARAQGLTQIYLAGPDRVLPLDALTSV